MSNTNNETNEMRDKLKFGLSVAKSEYEQSMVRFRDLDNKLNMLLVFLASEVAAFSLVVTAQRFSGLAATILAGFSLALIALALLGIMVGFVPRRIRVIDTASLVDLGEYSKSFDKFIAGHIGGYNKCIQVINETNKFKSICLKTAFVLLGVAFCCLSATVVVICF